MARSQVLSLVAVVCVALGASSRRSHADTVLLEFHSPRCVPCLEMRPVMRQLSDAGHVIREIDVDRDRALAAQFQIESTPTYVVLVDGRERARQVGGASVQKMTELIHTAAAPGASVAPREMRARAQSPAAVDYVGATYAPAAGIDATAAAEPRAGRIVEIQDPFRTPRGHEAAAQRAPAPAAGAAPPVPGAPESNSSDVAHLIAATVRLSVADPQGRSTGTGAIVDARDGMALVLTCGHIFRESNGRGQIEISLFSPSHAGAVLRGRAAGELLDFDLDRDLALVRFRADGPVAVTPVAPLGTPLQVGAPATSVGCDHGSDPTAWTTRITAVDRFKGHPNVEAARAPVEGRSGGGLFNAQGQVIGVCYLAEPSGDEGIYASLPSIHAKLDELNLSMVYRAPSSGLVASATPAGVEGGRPDSDASMAVRGQEPTPSPSSLLGQRQAPNHDIFAATPAGPASAVHGSPTGAPAASSLANLSPEERASLEEIVRRGARSEVICIIRPNSPEGRSEVIKLNGMSPAFIAALSAAANAGRGIDGAAPPGDAAAAVR